MPSFQALTVHRLLLAILICLLFILGYYVIEMFIIPAAWAGILAYVTWPAYSRLGRRLGQRPNLSAALMTLALTLLIVLPLLFAVFTLRAEAAMVYDTIAARAGQGQVVLPDYIRDWPFAQQLQHFLDHLFRNPDTFKAQVQVWFQKGFGAAAQVAGSIGKNLGKMMMVLFILFFFYRDGREIIRQLQKALQVLIGERVHRYIKAIGDTTRAVVYGIVLTALAQGFLAGVGYAVAGMESPVFLGAITTLVAMIPFGTPFAWGSVAIWLLAQGHHVEGIGLAIWGTLVVSSIDNVIRPLVISSATQIPFLLVMFGVLGGLGAFGMVGLFLGPVILAILMAIWRQWLDGETQTE
jgi:predicted PurR-regulated permease PerM